MMSLGKAKQGRSPRIALRACWMLDVALRDRGYGQWFGGLLDFFWFGLKIACDRPLAEGERFLIEMAVAMVMRFRWTFLCE